LLRDQTAPLHALTESLLGLPRAIRTTDDYIAWLGRFLGIYQPLEHRMAEFSEWREAGISPSGISPSGIFPSGIFPPARGHGECLAADLAALSVDPRVVPRAPHWSVPELAIFPHAIGALYVMEGATLGGRLILRDLEPRIGPVIAGATSFFAGRGEMTGPLWRDFRRALDSFGLEQPWHRAAVVTGAERTFRAILAWFAPFLGRDRRP
jgi:heme oxygenase